MVIDFFNNNSLKQNSLKNQNCYIKIKPEENAIYDILSKSDRNKECKYNFQLIAYLIQQNGDFMAKGLDVPMYIKRYYSTANEK